MNEILFLVGGICIVGSSFYFANKQQKENEKLLKMNKKLDYRNIDLQNNYLELLKKIDKVVKEKEYEKKTLKDFNDALIEVSEFDNDLMTKKTEKIEKLTSDLSFAREVAFARYDEINYLRKKINVIRSKRLLKVVRAEKLF